MRYIGYVDSLFMSFFTKIAHSFQYFTGRTSLLCASICYGMGLLGPLVQLANFFIPDILKPYETPFFIVFLDLLLITYLSIRIIKLGNEEERFFNNPSVRKLIPFLEHAGILGRVSLMGTSFVLLMYIPFLIYTDAIDSLSLIFYFWVFFMASGIYFEAVDPLPPGKSKVREWVEKVLFKPQSIREHAPNA